VLTPDREPIDVPDGVVHGTCYLTAESLREQIGKAVGEGLLDATAQVIYLVQPKDSPAPDATDPVAEVTTLYRLVRAMADVEWMPSQLTLLAVARPSEVTLRAVTPHPAIAAAAGLLRALANEDESMRCTSVVMGDRANLEEVLDDVLSRSGGSIVAHANGARLSPELHAVASGRGEQPTSVGAILVSGGLGGLGLQVARRLSRTLPEAPLVLIGRSVPPPRNEWAAHRGEATSRWATAIAVLEEIEKRGTRIRWFAGDCSDTETMASIVEAVRAEFGSITMVIHAAGVAGDGFLMLKEEQTLASTMRPKVKGVQVLDHLTRDDRPTMVLFSSTVALFGAAGQSDYTAANAYLDAYAAQRADMGLPTMSIGWSDWVKVGMAADNDVVRDRGFFATLEVEEALDCLDELLTAPRPHVLVGPVNVDMLSAVPPDVLSRQLADGPVRVSRSLRDLLARREAPAVDGVVKRTGSQAAMLTGRADGDYSQAERLVAQVWATELGLDSVNIDDVSFDLGGDSLIALRVAAQLQKDLGVRVTIVDLFRHLTVRELAAHLDKV